MDKIFLEGVELYGYIGVLPDEKKEGQTFYIDIEIGADLQPAGKSDSLGMTINYAEVFALAERLMEEARFDLIEAFAEQLSEEIFAYFDLARTVKITVHKPQAPIEGNFRSVGVIIRRSRP